MSTDAFIILATGHDRPGIVNRISGALYEAGCNLEDSRMSILGGEFALIVLVTGGPESLARARDGLEALAEDMELALEIKPTERRKPQAGIPYRMHVVAMDHPGIVHKITKLLSASGVNVARLDTRVSQAPISGTPIFSLDLEAQIPPDLQIAKLRSQLMDLGNAENIDVEFHPAD